MVSDVPVSCVVVLLVEGSRRTGRDDQRTQLVLKQTRGTSLPVIQINPEMIYQENALSTRSDPSSIRSRLLNLVIHEVRKKTRQAAMLLCR